MLSKYRALDLTGEEGFLCGRLLADLGVDVIKIEPTGGDPARRLGPFYHDEPDPERNLHWWAYNAGKKSVTLDLTTERDRKAFLQLVTVSDIVVESYPPGRMAELGLSHDELSWLNPGIITVSITGFGQSGPYARHECTDIVCMAASGYMNLLGEPDRPPLRISLPQAFLHAANDAAAAAMIALWHRELTGQGQWVDVSAQECMAWQTFTNHVYWDFRKLSPTRANTSNAGITPGQDALPVMFACKDGQVLFTATPGRNGNRTRRFIEWMVEEGWISSVLAAYDWDANPQVAAGLTARQNGSDPQATGPLSDEDRELLQQKRLELRQEFVPFILSKTRKELFKEAVARGLLLAPVNSVDEVYGNAHLAARGFWEGVDYPEVAATITYPGRPHGGTGFEYRVPKRAPHVGEHNPEILTSDFITTNRRKDRLAVEPAGSTEVFKGLRIIDFSWVIVGPRTTRYFADHGATVVKIEAPERPDIGRAVPPFKDDIIEPDRSGLFALYNANKYSMTIDLTMPQGLTLAKRLVQWADVLVESFRPGVMERLGLDHATTAALNPRLVYASTCLFGQTGPYRDIAGYGHHAAAFTAFDDLVGWPDRTPCGVFWAYTDHIAPQFLVRAIIAALMDRERTGRGQYVEQSQIESALHFLAPAFLDYSVNGRVMTRNGNRDPHAAPHGAYRCAGEDRWCVIAVRTDQEWRALCRVAKQSVLAADRRFATLESRKKHEDELDRLVESWTSQLAAEVVVEQLQTVGVPAGIVANAEDMHCDPQFRHRSHFLTFEHPVIGPHDVDALPFRLSSTPAKQYSPEPCLGEHNAHICTDVLGMSDEEFLDLLQSGALGE